MNFLNSKDSRRRPMMTPNPALKGSCAKSRAAP
jgi:hypothetical protein